LGVDSADDGVKVTAEVINPGNGDEQVGTFSKTVSAEGKTVVEALQNIAEKTGKETSLGQCVLIAFGEEFAKKGLSNAIEYFAKSDSVRENSAVCCVKGAAEQLFSTCDALQQSVSLSVADKLNGQFEKISLPSCDLLTFYRSQNELYRTGFLNYVFFEQSQNADEQNPDKTQVFFCCDSVAIFRENVLVGLLSEEETQGFSLLKSGVSGTLVPVSEEDGSVVTLRANSKDVNIDAKADKISVRLSLSVKLARTDSFGSDAQLSAKTGKRVSESALAQYKEKARELASLFLQKQAEWDFDLLEIHEMFRQKYGTTKQVSTIEMSQLTFELSVSVEEE